MRKKLLFTLLFVLFFISGCNKKEEEQPLPTPTAVPTETATPTPTPSPTVTPTPVPENLAMTGLQSLSASLDSFQDYFPEDAADYSEGAGYDIVFDLTIGSEFASLFGLDGLDQLRLDGTIDVKDTLAAQGTLYLKEEKLLTGELFTDYETVFYNLPDYSNKYAACSLEEFLPDSEEDLTEYTRVAFGNDRLDFLLTNIKNLLACFEPQDGMEPDCTIGTVTGDKYSVRASAGDIKSILNTLITDDRTLDVLRDPLTTLYDMDFTYLQLDYYAGENDSYAWVLTPDVSQEYPVVFTSTQDGFRFYAITDTGEKLYCSSETTGTKAGTITIPADTEDGADTVIKYKFKDKAFSVEAENASLYFSLDYSINEENIKYDATIMVEGVTILTKVEGSQETSDVSIILATYGTKLLNLDIQMQLRDYCEAAAPQDFTDADTWESRFNYNAFSTDMNVIMEKFPQLRELFAGDEKEEEPSEATPTPEITATREYENEFADMTGYAVDENGYVDFEPLESEVFAKNQPSTGFQMIELPEGTKENLLDFIATYFEHTYEYKFSYYSISGSVEEGIYSYYCQSYSYADDTDYDYDNYFNVAFDPISGDLLWVYCYHKSADEALNMANNILEILDVDYIITEENWGYYDIYDNYYIEAVLEDECYTIYIGPNY